MDREARNALNISDVVVTEYIPPTSPLHILVLLSLLYLMVSSACHSYIVPGTFYYDKVLRFFPGGPEWYLWVQKVLLLPVLGIHLVESLWMARSKMPKYGVRRWSGLWWKWVGSCALEGFGAHQRINALVRRTAMDMEKRKH